MKCQHCKASLTGTIDTFGEGGETLCASCWFDGVEWEVWQRKNREWLRFLRDLRKEEK